MKRFNLDDFQVPPRADDEKKATRRSEPRAVEVEDAKKEKHEGYTGSRPVSQPSARENIFSRSQAPADSAGETPPGPTSSDVYRPTRRVVKRPSIAKPAAEPESQPPPKPRPKATPKQQAPPPAPEPKRAVQPQPEPEVQPQPMPPAASASAVFTRPNASPNVQAVRNPSGPQVQALRKLVGRLLISRRDQKLEPLAVVSVEPGDGRSFIASNLAVLFAQSGKRTLLIDADFRHADQHNLFNMEAGPGLAELLLGQAQWDVIKPVEAVPDLYLLPFGSHRGDPLELLASDAFADVFAKLVDVCDVVLVDTPAAGEYLDASAIAAQIGNALMVIKRDETSINKAHDVTESMERAGVHMLGAVINQA